MTPKTTSKSTWSPAARTPLPVSDIDSDSDSGSAPAVFAITQTPPNKVSCATHAAALADRLNTLDLKAHEHSLSHPLASTNRHARREFTRVYLQEPRFDPAEAAMLEQRFQEKVRTVCDARAAIEAQHARAEAEKRLVEEERRAEVERQQREAAERAERERKEAEERRARAELERIRREKELAEVAEREKAARMAREVQEQQEREKKERREKAEAEAEAQAAAARAQADAERPQVYGRKSSSVEGLAGEKVIAALHKLRHDVASEQQFVKDMKLLAIRRGLRPKFGQLNGERTQTAGVREYLKRIFFELREARDGPTISANLFFLNQDPACEVLVPIAFIWTVNEAAKLLVKQVVSECAMRPGTADPIGVAVVSTFADESLTIHGHSFVDIIIARLIKKNPLLKGELGPETTERDRKRLGWTQDADGKWESEEDHINRMVGLTAGFTAIAGRNFGASKLVNPYPIFNLWHIVAHLLNVTTDQLTNSHYFVMKTLLEVGAKKLVDVYGHQAKKLVELAVGPWASRSDLSGATAVMAFGKFLKNEEWWKNS